jgi:Ca2+-binding EF-hand superfamily protein
MREGIHAAGLPFYDAFRMFDHANIGLISASGLWGAMDWLKIEMSAEDILDFMRTVDTKGDG